MKIRGFSFGRNSNIDMVGGRVIVNGVDVTDQVNAKGDDIHTLRIEGDVGNVTTDASVNCDNVKGDVQAGGSVNCDRVSGSVSAGGSVNCDDVGGSVTAGGSVRYG